MRKTGLVLLLITAVLIAIVLFAPLPAYGPKALRLCLHDTVTFENGEKLLGHFEGLIGGAAKFKSDKLGAITVDLGKIQELHSRERFAVLRKGLKLKKGETDGKVLRRGRSLSLSRPCRWIPATDRRVQTMPLGEVATIR